jgi:Uma2 family endonuclease
MKTAVATIGPADHGRPFSDEQFRHVDFEPCYKYELIEGRLYVSYEADLPSNSVEDWLYLQVRLYSLEHPEVINYVTNKARVFVPALRRVTIPEPDLTAYHDFPHHLPLQDLRWQDLSPLLVGEVVSKSDPDKGFVRNVRLYLQVPTIREYWILDPRDDPAQPILYVYRRRGSRWQRPIEVAPGDTYTTKLLPGFKLILDPRR